MHLKDALIAIRSVHSFSGSRRTKIAGFTYGSISLGLCTENAVIFIDFSRPMQGYEYELYSS